MYEYQEDKPYERYRDDSMLYEIKKHIVKNYYPHFHYATEICYLIKGEFSFSINGKLMRLKEGEILFINPTEIHQYFESEEAEVLICIFSEDFSSDFVAEFGSSAFDNILRDREANLKIYQIMEEGFKEQKDNLYIEKKIFVNRIYSVLCHAYEKKEHQKAHFILNQILEYIYNNYNQNLSISDIAEKLSYSPTTISKIFQKNIGVDFRVFVNNVRVDIANKMLNDKKYKDCPLIEIVYECGFESLSTFYRSYKRRFGTLPKHK